MSGFGDQFQGLEPPPEALAIDTAALARWVDGRLPGCDGAIEVAKFKGGQSNPTYRLDTAAGPYVLRRRPPGVGASSAHAVDREFKVLHALAGTGVPAPRVFLYCEDEGVIGSAFYLAEFVPGRVFWSAELPELRREERSLFYDDLNACLARINGVDIDAVGLADLGRREGYTKRNFERWWKGYQASKVEELPDMNWLADALRERLPASEPVTLIHGDLGVYNVMADAEAPKVAAALDWEMATIGNPLVDLAHTMRPWLEPPAATGGRPTLADKDLAALGIPTMAAFVERWSDRTGILWADGDFYLGYAMFRYAAMVQGVLKRFADGTAANRNMVHTQHRVAAIAGKGRHIVEQGAARVMGA